MERNPPKPAFTYTTGIWQDIPHDDDPFAPAISRCFGFDVHGDLLKNAGWFEYLLLLFKGEPPAHWQARLLEKVAMVLTNPGPRDASVRAAMAGGTGGSPDATVLIAALGIGAGQQGGAHEVETLVNAWSHCDTELTAWQAFFENPDKDYVEDVWAPYEHAPGFAPHGARCAATIIHSLEYLASISQGHRLTWLQAQRPTLEKLQQKPLAMPAVIAAAFADLGLAPSQASMLFLILRLPGAAAHALEQRALGWKASPFYAPGIELQDDPGAHPLPDISRFDL